MGEEWRKGWHPEKIEEKGSDGRVLIVGAGPTGLEAARALGARGYDVMLAEATRDLGGRVTRECALPGMSEYVRVRAYREQELLNMSNVEVFRESALTADDVFATEPDHVAIATGATWRRERFNGEVYVSVVVILCYTQVFYSSCSVLSQGISMLVIFLIDLHLLSVIAQDEWLYVFIRSNSAFCHLALFAWCLARRLSRRLTPLLRQDWECAISVMYSGICAGLALRVPRAVRSP